MLFMGMHMKERHAHTHHHHSGLQRVLEARAPSASLVLGEMLSHIAKLRTREPGEMGVPVSLRVDRHGEICIERSAAIALDMQPLHIKAAIAHVPAIAH